MKKQVLVIGAGRFGVALATTLTEGGHEVVVLDRDEAALKPLMDDVAHAAVGDGSDVATLRELGASNFDVVVVAVASDFEAGVLCTVAARSADAKRLVAKATTGTAARVLAAVGADEVVRPEHDLGVRLAHQIATPSIVDAFQLGPDHEVVEVEVDDASPLQGPLAELRLPNRLGVQIIAVTRAGALSVNPGADFAVRPGDRLVAIGATDAIQALQKEIAG